MEKKVFVSIIFSSLSIEREREIEKAAKDGLILVCREEGASLGGVDVGWEVFVRKMLERKDEEWLEKAANLLEKLGFLSKHSHGGYEVVSSGEDRPFRLIRGTQFFFVSDHFAREFASAMYPMGGHLVEIRKIVSSDFFTTPSVLSQTKGA